MIDRAFVALMKERYKHNFTNLSPEKTDPNSKLLIEFQRAKEEYVGGDQDREWRLHLKMRFDGLFVPEQYDEDENEIILKR